MRAWALPAAIAVALASIGCGGSNTRCEVGTRLCTEDGLAAECQDETGMGDADGEFITLRDCAAEGLECLFEAIDQEHSFVGCVDPACASACPVEGARVCSRDGQNVSVCVRQTDGCLRRSIEQACADTGATCQYTTGDEPACLAP
ncbi:MAG: hypothetical protein M5U28_18635 [Sandaracinaceae bacterium]|nr:hypothetical protein [Sandaracinaceae bacterium]